MNTLELNDCDLLALILALWDAERVNQTAFPATAHGYRKLREKLDAVAASNRVFERNAA